MRRPDGQLGRRSDGLVDPELRPTAHRYRTIRIQAGPRTVSAAALLPGDLREAVDRIYRHAGAH